MPLAESEQQPGERLRAMQARHRRAEMRCGLLERLVEQLAQHSGSPAARVSAAALVDYFDTFVREERADRLVFTQLVRAASRRRRQRTAELASALIQAQEEIAGRWDRARVQLVELASGARDRVDATLVGAFVAPTLAHVTRDERELEPLSEAATNAQRPERPAAPADRRSDWRATAPTEP